MTARQPPRKSRPRAADGVYGVLIPIRRGGQSRSARAIYPKEFTPCEVAAIGVITIQWAYLEHMLLIRTAQLVNKAGLSMPYDARSGSFSRRLDAWREIIKATVKDNWQRRRLLSLATRVANIEQDRHKITHGLWQWYPTKPTKLRVYSFRLPHTFDDNFDHERLARLADRIGEINFELTHPPRRGLKKLEPDEGSAIATPYMSRGFLLRAMGADTVALGLDPPPPTQFTPISTT